MRQIRKFGDDILRQQAKPVKKVTKSIQSLLDEMAEIMYAAPGAGLAAPQIGIGKCVIVADDGDGLIELINPELIKQAGAVTAWEGCLSYPGMLGLVERAEQITVKGLDRNDRDVWIDASDWKARVLQHEIDHLHGKLFVDRAIDVKPEEEVREESDADRLKVVAAATPDFALPVLDMLHEHHDLELVITQPDRPVGRGKKVRPPAAKQWARDNGVKVIQPDVPENNLSGIVKRLEPDVLVVVAYGHIVPKSLLDAAALGAINVHASLLPAYRGAAPIQWAIMNGNKETGVTTMWMDEGMDTGDIALQSKVEIRPDETAGSLHDRLSVLGADVLKQTLELMKKSECPQIAQDNSKATYARSLTSCDEIIDWSASAEQIDRQVRGLSPYPGAYTMWDGHRIKIREGRPVKDVSASPPGRVMVASDGLVVACGDGCYRVERLQRSGAKEMSSAEFIRGRQDVDNAVWGCD